MATPGQHPTTSLSDAKAALANKDFSKAVEESSDAILASPRNAVAYTLRAEALRRLGQPDRALADLAVAIRIDPDRASPFVIRAEIFKKRCQFDQAIADATQAIFLQPDNGAAFSIRADCRRSIGDADGATFDAQELFRIDPTRLPNAPVSTQNPATDILNPTARDTGQAERIAQRCDDSVFADGASVDRSYKARKAISTDDAAELLADESGYRPAVIARPLSRTRSTSQGTRISVARVGAAVFLCALLGMGGLLLRSQSEARLQPPPAPEPPAGQLQARVAVPTRLPEEKPPDRAPDLEAGGEVVAVDQGPKKEVINVRRLRFSVSETGECALVVDQGEAGALHELKEGNTSLAGISDAHIVKGEDGRLTITHLFREVKGLSDFARFAGTGPSLSQGLSLDKVEGSLIMTPVKTQAWQGRKQAVLCYPRHLALPIAVTLDLERLPDDFMMVVLVQQVSRENSLEYALIGGKQGMKLVATLTPPDRKKATLFEQAIVLGRPFDQGFQLPPGIFGERDRLNLNACLVGDATAALSSLEVEAKLVAYFGINSVNPKGPMILKSLEKGTPAERSGLRQGDIVESIGGTKVRNNSEGVAILGQIPVGEDIKIVVRRAGKSSEFTLHAE